MNRQTLVVSFSGGKTSAFMARWLQINMAHEYDIKYIFANTGQEEEQTLEFVSHCAGFWNMDIVWVEAKVNHERGVGTRHKVVSFGTASRNGEPFEEVIKKYGIPNQAYPHCTRELKLAPINSYVASQGWDDRLMAVGIRADEIDRMSQSAKQNGIIYPLISMHPTTLDDVNLWWESQPFNLDLPQYRGNCLTCWKKSVRKLCTIFKDTPRAFDFFDRMERIHGLAGHNVDGTPRTFFRKNRDVSDIKLLTLDPEFTPFIPSEINQPDLFWDAAGACSESCDIYADDMEFHA